MPAMAAPVVTGGLVNVTIVDAVDVDRTTVQVPVAVAANVCGVNVIALNPVTQQLECEAGASGRANNNNR